MFEKLGEIVDVNDVPQHLCGDIAEHLSCLKGEFDHYFPEITTKCCWFITKPLTAPVTAIPDSEEETQNDLLQLQTNSAAKIKWEELWLPDFWIAMTSSYPHLTLIALQYLWPFPSMYLCETGFLALVEMKTKYCNHLEVEDDLRCCLSNTATDTDELVAKVRCQPAH